MEILPTQQMGKTSLMTRILAYAKTQGDRTVSLNLQQMGLVHLQNLQASLACELFRPFFGDRLS